MIMAEQRPTITKIDWDLFPEKYNDIIVHFSDNHRDIARFHTIEHGEMDSLSFAACRGYIIYAYMFTGEVEHYEIVDSSTGIVTNINQYKERYVRK